jgi:hypothetical protein
MSNKPANEDGTEAEYILDRVGSHIPVLDLIKRLSRVRRILELGSGVYSTPKLLEFPEIELLISYEDSKPWFDKVAKIKHDKFKLILEGNLSGLAKWIDLEEFDLIFIDCCEFKEQRIEVVREISKRRPDAIVVIHDFDDEQVKWPDSIVEFDNVIVYDKLWPTTGILWNQTDESSQIQGVRFEGIQGIINA